MSRAELTNEEIISRDLGIKCSEIVSKKEIKYLEGYKFETSLRTWKEFMSAKRQDTGFKVGNICLDLIDMNNGDIIETITLDRDYFFEVLTQRTKQNDYN